MDIKIWDGLLGKIADGDRSAMMSFYDESCRYIFGLVTHVLGDPTMAEEVLLDVYTQVWRQAASFDAKSASALRWLVTIARTYAISRLLSEKKDRSRQKLQELSQSELLGSRKERDESTLSKQQKLVLWALDALTTEQRQVIALAYYSGMSHIEIADQLVQPLATVRTRIRLGMAKLSGTVRPLFEEGTRIGT